MKQSLRTLALGGALATCMALGAQNTFSGYFLDGYTYRYQLNPAFGNEKNFVAMPALGDIDLAMRGNLHTDEVLYNVDGKTVLFTNPGVSADEAMKGFSDKNRVGADVRVNILSGGWKAWGGYNAISINARADVNAIIPKAFFSLAKEGISNQNYDIHNMDVSAMGYAEIALNHSRDIKQVPGLRVGATVKFLVGVAQMQARFNEANIILGEDGWVGTTNADIYASIGKFEFEHDRSDDGREYVSGCNLDGEGSHGPNGFGMAFDLGATYKWRDFDFSLALLDLGWISFQNTRMASTNGTRTVNTDAYTFSAEDYLPDGSENPHSFENEWDNLRDNLEELYQLTDNGDIGRHNRTLGMTMNIGVGYTFPLYRKLSFGFLSTTRFAGRYTWSEARISANVAPVKCFSADVNMVAGSFGVGFGWLMSYHGTGFNIFLGMDRTLGRLAKQGVPLNSNASFNLGINFPF